MSPSLQVAVSLEEPSPSDEDERPEKPVCATCNSPKVTFEATAYWNAEEQLFEYDHFGDQVFCFYCDGKQNVNWIPV